MAAKEEQTTLGSLILQTGIAVKYIKDVRIEEAADKHGRMKVRFLTDDKMEDTDMVRLDGSDITLRTEDGENVFCGKCVGFHLIRGNQYAEVELAAETASVLKDRDKNSVTFQGEKKTLDDVLAKGIGRGSLVQIDQNITIADMLSQENETDWEFGRRIANQYKKQFFVNSKTAGCQIHVGRKPFAEKDPGRVLYASVGRDVVKARAIQQNVDPGACVFEFEETTLAVCDLTIGAGYAVTHQGRSQMVISSLITCKKGLLQNEITLVNREGVMPEAAVSMETMTRSGVLTGTVLEVKGTDVRVDFGSEGDSPRWMPYANAVNNYFYCMPDVGDSVFVYYETGDSGRIVCLGSKHVRQSPDFGRYQDKMFTANNRMIRFGDKTLSLVGNRKEADGYGGEQAKIIFNDENGIEILSTKDITLLTTDSGNITIQSVQKGFKGPKAVQQKFDAMNTAGNALYMACGGSPADYNLMVYRMKQEWGSLVDDVTELINSPGKLLGTLSDLAGAIGGSEGTQDEQEAPQYEDGVISILALKKADYTVGSTCVSFGDGVIQIKADTFLELGTDRSKTYELMDAKPVSWTDLILDVVQLGLDIVGMLPIPVVSTVANLVNAGVSLARGDYIGAAMSAGSAVLSLVPGANTVAVGAKLALKAPKLIRMVGTITKTAKALVTGAKMVMAAVSGLTFCAAADKLIDTVANGRFDPADPECWRDVVGVLSGAAGVVGSARDLKDIGKRGGGTRGNEAPRTQTQTQPHRQTHSDTGARKKQTVDEIPDSRVTNGDPIDVVTGSFLMEQCDFVINDITGVCAVERIYESLLAGEDSPVGKGWTLSLFIDVFVYDDRVEIRMPDHHTETFLKTAEGFRSRRGGTKSLTLKKDGESYLLWEEKTGLLRTFDAAGKQISATDKNGNRTIYHYAGDTLRKIVFASGQYLEFVWQGDKIASMEDCIGRKVTYHYDGALLTGVEMVNGGVEKYAYDAGGRITDVTNANGVQYIHNEYDHKGRITRQTLFNGQEYILLYADDDRTNTWLVPQNNKEIRYIYNKNRQLIRTEYRDGTVEEFGYDDWENRVWEKDRSGGETHRTFDEYGRLLREEQPDGLVLSYEYDADGNQIRMWDNTGYAAWYTCDKHGNRIKEMEQIDASVQRTITYEYDKYGRITALTDPNGNRETYEYDSRFWEASAFVTATGNRFVYGIDKAGRCVTITDSDGTKEYAYNNFDIVCMEKNPLGDVTRYIYDGVIDLVGVVRPNHYAPLSNHEKRECFTYDPLHNQISRTDETGAVFVTLRDGEGNIVKEIHPDAYEAGGKDGSGIAYTYDEYDQRSRIFYPDGGTERRWYDAAGNLTRVCRPGQYDAAADDGEGYCYEYDRGKRLTQITAPDGSVRRRFVYDLHGNPVKVIDARGMHTGETDEERIGEFSVYNCMGWLLEKRQPVTEENGQVYYRLIQYRYDKAGNRICERRFLDYQTKTSASGVVQTISCRYDADNRLIQVNDDAGAVLEYGYDAHDRCIRERRKISDGVSQTFRYVYDAAGRMTEFIRTADKSGCGRQNVSVKYEYDRNGNNTRTVLASGCEVLREYDAADRLILERHVDKNGGIDNTTRFSYDKAGNLVCIADNQGRKTQMEYDLMGQEVRRTDKNGGVTRYYYDKNGRLVSVIRPNEYRRAGENGAGETYTYDADGNVLTVVRADGVILESNTYDEDGRLLRTTDAAGAGAAFQYDIGGRRIEVRSAGGAVQKYEYDAFGNVTGIVDGVGSRTQYIVDKWGRVVQVRHADESSEFYSYDYAGNITRSTDGEGNTTVYEYNGINQMAVRTDPLGNQEIYAYDDEGRLCRKTDRNGVVTRYTYNIYGSLLGRRAEGATGSDVSEWYEYTPEGLLKSAVSKSSIRGRTIGMRYSYIYDEMGRLRQKLSSGRILLEFAYDLNGNFVRQTDVSGKVTEYRYNLFDEVEEVWDNGKQIAKYGYNPDGTIKTLRCGDLFTEYAYDADRNLAGIKTVMGEEVLAEEHYLYDGNGNRIQKRQRQGVTSYVYDVMNRLVGAEYPERTEELFYDRAGNRTMRVLSTRPHVGGEQYCSVAEDAKTLFSGPERTEERYQYDSANRLIQYEKGGKTHRFEYDAGGNLTKDDRATYEYDASGRNVVAELFDGNIQISHYDAEGLRHEMEENGRLVSFLFRGTEIVAEESGTETVRYIRADRLVASDAEASRTYYHYASDEMGSITHVAESGNVVNWYMYDAWGSPTVCEEKIENRFRFNGQQYDGVTGQYYLRARYYNPVIGRFTQEDSYLGDGLNLYTYCAGNPVSYEDPDGHACQKGADRVKGAQGKNNATGQKPKKTYQTYTKTNPQTGEVYTGRTSGYGTPEENIAKRDRNHHKNKDGFGPAVLDKTSDNPDAIRGREQDMIDYHGGAKSKGGSSGNDIQGISDGNKKRDTYLRASQEEFGKPGE